MNQVRLNPICMDRPIQAIKAVRVVTGLGLRESKGVVDRVRGWDQASGMTDVARGKAQLIAVAEGIPLTEAISVLREGGLSVDLLEVDALSARGVVLEALDAMPSHLTVAEVTAVLRAVM